MKPQKTRYFLVMLIVAVLVTMPTFVLGGGKVTICHYPPGNPENAQITTINESALEEHLAHGDQLGECPCPATLCPAEVKVVNDETEPIPIAGETTVSGSVSIQGTPNVNVVNDAFHPVPVTGQVDVTSQREPTAFAEVIDCSDNSGCISDIYSVPEGKRLTIEYFSCNAWLFGGQSVSCYIRTCTGPGNVNNFHIPPTPIAPEMQPPIYGSVGIGQKVKIYATESLCPVQVGFYKVNFPHAVMTPITFNVSGYLEDIP